MHPPPRWQFHAVFVAALYVKALAVVSISALRKAGKHSPPEAGEP